eukprot:Hpha_TRINITY_DN16919_c1_g1::TRINITY_DN16919_c1_g1_i2::g.56406::m.56406
MLRKQLHQVQQQHEETRLQFFDLQERHSALETRHREVTAANRRHVRGLERRLDAERGGQSMEADERNAEIPTEDQTAPGPVEYVQQSELRSISTGQRVAVLRDGGAACLGTVRFVGRTLFAAGEWVGVEVDDAEGGRHDGEVDGMRYFSCRSGHGLFVRPSAVASERRNCRRCVRVGSDPRSPRPRPRTVSRRSHSRSSERPPTYQTSTRGAPERSRSGAPDPYLTLAVSLKERLEDTNRRLESAERQLARQPGSPTPAPVSPLRSPARPGSRLEAGGSVSPF